MHLTREEEAILAGSMGDGYAKAMKVVVKVAEALEAPRLIRIEHAHISGISYKNIGESGLKFLESLAESGAKASVPATINPAGMDLEKWRRMGISEEFALKQLRVIRALTKLGLKPTLTCTPYLYEKIPRRAQVAWAESNAVLYANSICELYTNREGGPLALMEAIVGRAPYVDYRIDENRKPTVIVDLRSLKRDIRQRSLYAAVGYFIGRMVKEGVPLLLGLPPDMTLAETKLMLAAIGTSGSLTMVRLGDSDSGLPRVRVSNLQDIFAELPAALSDEGVVALGCPHLSPGELSRLANLASKYGKPKRRVIVFTARAAKRYAPKALEILVRQGFEVYYDTCMVVADLKAMGVDEVLVDSAKAAYYLSTQGFNVGLFLRSDIKRILYD